MPWETKKLIPACCFGPNKQSSRTLSIHIQYDGVCLDGNAIFIFKITVF